MNPIIKEDIKDIVRRMGFDIQKLSGKKILLTGATGLIGSYFVETIVYLNDEKRVN